MSPAVPIVATLSAAISPIVVLPPTLAMSTAPTLAMSTLLAISPALTEATVPRSSEPAFVSTLIALPWSTFNSPVIDPTVTSPLAVPTLTFVPLSTFTRSLAVLIDTSSVAVPIVVCPPTLAISTLPTLVMSTLLATVSILTFFAVPSFTSPAIVASPAFTFSTVAAAASIPPRRLLTIMLPACVSTFNEPLPLMLMSPAVPTVASLPAAMSPIVTFFAVPRSTLPLASVMVTFSPLVTVTSPLAISISVLPLTVPTVTEPSAVSMSRFPPIIAFSAATATPPLPIFSIVTS